MRRCERGAVACVWQQCKVRVRAHLKLAHVIAADLRHHARRRDGEWQLGSARTESASLDQYMPATLSASSSASRLARFSGSAPAELKAIERLCRSLNLYVNVGDVDGQVQDGILSCPRCKSKKTEYVEVQTRSADEPTTKKCLCNDCEYRWKFC